MRNQPARLALCFGTILLITIPACKSSNRVSDASIRRIERPDLLALLADPKQAPVIIDVRTETQFAARHLPNAINIPLPNLTRDDPRLTPASAIVVYAAGWKDDLSAAAAKRLLTLGYQNVYDFRGGLEQWYRDRTPTAQ